MIGTNVQRVRIARGLTQLELANRIGRWHTLVGQIEAGKRQPSLETLMNLATALDVSVEELLRPDAVEIVESVAE